jgi:ABC-2 family transporter protein
LVAIILLVFVAIAFGVTGSHLAHIYNVYAKAQAACQASPTCPNVSLHISTVDSLLKLIGTALVAAPALVGAFWGAPLISREFENGTHRLAWTQSITRTRWVTVKLLVIGAAGVIATGLLSLMVTWWSSAMDSANTDRFGAGLFGERNIVPLGYAAFAFVLGVAAGIVLRRALPAMAVTLALFLGIRIAFTYVVRQHLIPPRHSSTSLSALVQGYGSSNGGQSSLFLGSNRPNAWVYSTRAVDASGNPLTARVVDQACPALSQPPITAPSGSQQHIAVPDSAHDALQTCVAKLSATYHGVITYQPANRYWLFQCSETLIFVAAALALGGFCFYWLRRHAA